MDQAKITRILTIVFYILTLGTFIAFFLFPDDRMPMIYLGFSAIGVRLITYFLRHFM